MKRLFVVLIICVATLAGAGVAAFFWAKAQFNSPGSLTENKVVIIPAGSGVLDIARRLADEGVVGDARLFALGVRYHKAGRGLKAGEFEFPAHLSPYDAMVILRSAKTVVRRVTVAEGLTTRQILAHVAGVTGLEGPVPANVAEGVLLPETYHFRLGDTRADLVERLRQDMETTVTRLWAARTANLPLKSSRDAVILASIVEKETGLAGERAHIAGVFINRLRLGMRLQSDPTVVYGLTSGSGPLGRKLTRADLKAVSPFNTYVISGLPPGPISNPGQAAIAAVLHPLETADLYFVADGTGGHLFARTLAAHNRNVAKWRREQRKKRTEKK